MSVLPGSRQLHFDSLKSSFTSFPSTPFKLLRYNSCSLIPIKVRSFCSSSHANKNPHRKLCSLSSDKHFSLRSLRKDTVLSGSVGWLSEWDKPNERNRLKPPQVVVSYRNPNAGGGTTMEKIVERLKKHGYIDGGSNDEMGRRKPERVIEKGSVEDIFYVEEGILPNAQGGLSKESPLGVEDVFRGDDGEVRFPWEKPRKEERGEVWTARKQSKTLLAELTLPASELRRLRNLTYQIKSKMKIGGAGVTEAVVNGIHEKWKTSEIVRIKVEGAPALNMKKMHEILERKTGGLVIWRSGTAVSLYRGVSYEVPSVQFEKQRLHRKVISTTKSLPVESGKAIGLLAPTVSNNEVDALQSTSTSSAKTEEEKETKTPKEAEYEAEVEKLLDGLGPRYTDWPGCDPLPVDADMLPGIIPGYQPPFRILPYGVRPTLGQKEATSLRRLARFLPPHFALGRRQQLQGLAAAMIKLWEKCSVAKIALKRGVQLTTSERMAEDLKKLTGGSLLSRNKDFLVFYRGKNFLSADAAEALLERARLAKSLQDEEEQARLKASAFVMPGVDKAERSGTAGTLEETLDADARWGKKLDDSHAEKIMKEAEFVRHTNIVRKLESKLAFAERRVMRAERALAKVEESLKPAERQADPESITEEERYMFRKIGLRMKAFLLIGRRGVFDGTVENMHLHWKYRELVKIILKAKSIEQAKTIALALEAESGGLLVSVDKVSKGYAIIVYRGKGYQRPPTLRPKNLLTKRKALARAKEIQRHEALIKHIAALESRVDKIRSEIEQMDIVKDKGDEKLYDRLDFSYPTDDDDNEEEENEAYLENYSSTNDETYNAITNISMETNFPYDDQNLESEAEPEACGSENDDYDIDGEESECNYEVENLSTNFSFNFQDQVSENEFSVHEERT